MSTSLFVSPPPRMRRTLYTVVGSVLLHGSIIAVAALWPVHYVPPAETVVCPLPPVEGDFLPVAVVMPSAGDMQPPADEPAPSSPTVEDAGDMPPSEEPSLMIEPAPPKPATKTVVSKVRSGRASSSAAMAAVGGHDQPGAPGGAGNSPGHPGTAGRWSTPTPAYPSALRLARVQGNGSVRITTDNTGRVVSVSVVQSTGNAQLDDNTGRYARGFWSGPPNASTTVPITYQLR